MGASVPISRNLLGIFWEIGQLSLGDPLPYLLPYLELSYNREGPEARPEGPGRGKRARVTFQLFQGPGPPGLAPGPPLDPPDPP